LPPKIVSPIKWTGSKSGLAPQLADLFPKDYRRVLDPFCGGGNMIPYYKSEVIAADSCEPLIDLWDAIQSDPESTLKAYTRRYQEVLNGESDYYKIRKLFNTFKGPSAFLYLLRNSVNGLVRFNKKGEFNASKHITPDGQKSRNGMTPTNMEKVFRQWQTYLESTTFLNQDYLETLRMVKPGDFVFLDPPYLGSKGKIYSGEPFDYECLWKALDTLNELNIPWMLCFGSQDLVPLDLYKRRVDLTSGVKSALKWNKKVSTESVYMNYEEFQCNV
jgi:DNA adenine methylase